MPNNINLTNQHELYHYGVKGMKWGVRRRYLNSDGSLNDRGIKKYARKAYAQDSLNRNKSWKGKAFDRVTGGHKTQAKVLQSTSSKKTNKAKAEQYLKDRQKSKSTPVQKKIGKAVVNKIQKNAEKKKQRDESIKKTTDWFGTGGVAINETMNYGRKYAAKKVAANAINGAANAYIKSDKGSYHMKRGADFARKAAINGLSASVYADRIRGARNVAKSYAYANSKRK